SSSSPWNECGFQRNRHSGALRYHAGRVVCGWTSSGYRCLIDAAAGWGSKNPRTPHFLPYGTASVDSVRIKLNSHRIRVEIVQKDFDFKHGAVRVGFDAQVSEAQRAPLPIDCMLPIDDLPADCAFIGNAQMVGGSSLKVVLLSVYAHRAVGREARCQACHAFPRPLDPCRGNAALVSGIKRRDRLPFEQV